MRLPWRKGKPEPPLAHEIPKQQEAERARLEEEFKLQEAISLTREGSAEARKSRRIRETNHFISAIERSMRRA
jgi:hypothetical protein